MTHSLSEAPSDVTVVLEEGLGPFPAWSTVATPSPLPSSRALGKVAPSSPTNEEMHLCEAQAWTPWRTESWQPGLRLLWIWILNDAFSPVKNTAVPTILLCSGQRCPCSL